MESHDDQSDHQGIVNLKERRRAVLLDRLAVLAAREPDIMEKIEAAAALESIGDTIRRIVAERGLTPYAVAKLAGKRNFTDIREFLRGERDVKLSTVEAICRGLGLTLHPDAPPEPKPRAAGRNRAKSLGPKSKPASSTRIQSGKRNGRIRVKRDAITPDHDATNLTE